MSNPALAAGSGLEKKRKSGGTFSRIAVYTLLRLVAIVLTVTVAVYLTILIANMGGKVDQIRLDEVRFNISTMVAMNEEYRNQTPAERKEFVDQLVAVEKAKLGLDKNFVVKSFEYLWNAITLSLGRAESMTSDSGSSQVRLIILERLFPTLLLFATAQLLLFFLGIFVALSLSRRYGSWVDKFIVGLAPSSAAPSWFYGIFLILLFASVWGILPFGGMVKAPPPTSRWEYALSVMKHLTLPVIAQVISSVFLTIYSWRTFFLIYSMEDYVEMAKAKGLTAGQIQRRHILRPTLPTIVTSFALTLIGLWTGAILLETVFNWPGLGRLIYQAINSFDTPVIVGTTVIYAYLLGVTVFLLDIIYALVDPRVQVGGGRSRA